MKRLAIAALLLASCAHSKPPAPAAQNPSPMVENTRAHQRIAKRALAGRVLTIPGILPKDVEVLVTPVAERTKQADLVIHFLGGSFLAMQAAEDLQMPLVVAVVNLGAGSSVYAAPFRDPATFTKLIAAIDSATGHPHNASFSHRLQRRLRSGAGDPRQPLRRDRRSDAARRAAHQLHSGREAAGDGRRARRERAGGLPQIRRRCRRGKEGVSHHAFGDFSGTFASTTETTDFLIHSLGLKRTPVVEWGPLGMQQLSETKSGSLTILGFAGNAAPDHMDHLHALGHFLPMLLQAPYVRQAALPSP